MCKIMQEIKEEGIAEGIAEGIEKAARENALRMLKIGKLTFDEIAEYSGLSIEKVQELAGYSSKD